MATSTVALKEEEEDVVAVEGRGNDLNVSVLVADDDHQIGCCINDDEVQIIRNTSETKIETTSTPTMDTLPWQQQQPNDEEDVLNEEEEGTPPTTVECHRRPDFEKGDHVYQWCSLLGIPGVFAHHGIVLDVFYEESRSRWYLSIADFDNWQKKLKNRQEAEDNDEDEEDNDTDGNANVDAAAATARQPLFQSSSSRTFNSSSNSQQQNEKEDASVKIVTTNLRIYKADPTQWNKVEYGVTGFWKQHFSRGGTVTKAQCDPPGVVVARVEFLMNIPVDKLPFQYDWIQSNCECIAVWCKCGIFTTLQGAQFLHGIVAGQMKSTVTVASAVATTQVTVPAAGVWGWLGYTTQVSLLSTQPWIVPALIVGGVLSIGAPAMKLAFARKHWKNMTETLNNEFWTIHGDRPDLLIDCIQHYKKHEGEQEGR